MIVNSKRLGVIMIPVLSGVGKVKQISKFIRLIYGTNEIEDKVWEDAKNDSSIAGKLLSGELTEIVEVVEEKNDDGKKTKKTVSSVKDMSPKLSDKVIQETYDLTLLNKWLGETAKESVRISLLKRIAVVEKETQGKES